MYSLEVPNVNDTDYEDLKIRAWEAINADYVEAREGREIVGGVLFCEKDRLSQVGVSTSARDSEDLLVDLHLPHLEAFIPPNSPLDDLMRYSFVHGNTQGRKISLPFWLRQFNPAAENWPALTLSIPLSHDSSGDLEIGRPEIAETLFQPTLQVGGRVRESLDRGEANAPGNLLGYLALAQQLAEQRRKHGAFEIYQDGRLWVRNRDGDSLIPMNYTDFIARELLLTAGISAGRWLKSQRQEALYLSHDHKPKLDADGIQDFVGQYFAGDLGAQALWGVLSEAGGWAKLSESHKFAFNNNAYKGPVTNLHTRWAIYTNTINMRIAGNQVVSPDSSLYSGPDLHTYAEKVYDMEVAYSRTRSKGIRVTGRRILEEAQSGAKRPRNVEFANLTPAKMAGLTSKQFKEVYLLSQRGYVERKVFIEACSARVRKTGSLPAIIAIDTLVCDMPTKRRAQAFQHALKEPMLLYVANNPTEAKAILQNAAVKNLIHNLTAEPMNDGTVTVKFVWKDQQLSVRGDTEHEAKAKALVKMASGGKRDITYYRQHDSAAQWRAEKKMSDGSPND